MGQQDLQDVCEICKRPARPLLGLYKICKNIAIPVENLQVLKIYKS